jgi:Flp pilus assembly protein TadD
MPIRTLFATCLLMLCTAAGADELGEVNKLLRAGDSAAALQRVERAVAAAPRDSQLRFLQGVILLDQKNDTAAMVIFQRLSEEFPELPEPFNNIALLHARAGQLDAARVALETALRNDPGMLAARQNLGDIHLRLALQAWEAVAAVTPADMALQRKLRLSRELVAPTR